MRLEGRLWATTLQAANLETPGLLQDEDRNFEAAFVSSG
jgi:hypothetical protein